MAEESASRAYLKSRSMSQRTDAFKTGFKWRCLRDLLPEQRFVKDSLQAFHFRRVDVVEKEIAEVGSGFDNY